MTMMSATCQICHTAVTETVTDLGATYRCDCGRTHGCVLNTGGLDLGVPKVSPERLRLIRSEDA